MVLQRSALGAALGRDGYDFPEGEVALYLDPAWLSVREPSNYTSLRRRSIGFSADLNLQLRKELNIVDAGCGSGILALSTSLLSFSDFSI